MTGRLLQIGGVAVAAAALLLLLAACGSKPAEAPAPVVRPVLSVIVHPLTSETVGPYVGTIEPRYQTPLSFQTSGRVIVRPVQTGDNVSTGQVLASLDASVQQFQLASAQADVASAQSQFSNLSASEERARALVSSGISAQAQLDTATSARQTAAAQLSQAKASLAQAQDKLGYASIVAGFDGVVILVGAEVGQVVSAGETVVTIARPDVREAVFELPEALASGLKPETQWKVSIVGAPAQVTTGTVREVAPQINGSIRSQAVRLTLANAPEMFRLGATVNVSYERPTPAQVRLPRTALLERDGKTFVWVVDPKAMTVTAKSVAVAGRSDTSVAVTSGLADGDRVVVAGVHSLEGGQAVKLDGEATP